MNRPQIHVLVDDPALTPTIRGALQHLDVELQLSPLGGPVDALRRELEALKQQERTLRDMLRGVDDQLRLAGTLQRDLQSPLPRVRGVTVSTFYQPAGPVSGDMFDVFRLDESHTAIAVADATGHDLAAAMLAVYVRRAIRGTMGGSGDSDAHAPDAVLTRVNRDLLAINLQECQFVTVVYAVYNERTRRIRWARAGAPFPVHARTDQPPRRIESSGPLLGVLPQPRFEVAELQLAPGASLTFHTDGLDLRPAASHPDEASIADPRTEWFQDLDREPTPQTARPVADFQQRLENRLTEMAQDDGERDDVTVITLRVDGLE